MARKKPAAKKKPSPKGKGKALAARKKAPAPESPPPAPEPPKPRAYDLLEGKQQRFVDEYLIDLNGAQAAIRSGYSIHTARAIAYNLLTKVDIQAAVEERKADRLKRVEISQDDVLHRLRAIAFADPNELVVYRRVNCRYCWGIDFKYQRTPAEFESDRVAHERLQAEAQAGKGGGKVNVKLNGAKVEVSVGDFDEMGGSGFLKNGKPNPECPECAGEGIGDVFFRDTRELSDAGRALYAGAKIGKDGVEVKALDQTRYHEMLAKHTRVYEEKAEVNIGIVNVGALDDIYERKMAEAQAQASRVIGRSDRLHGKK